MLQMADEPFGGTAARKLLQVYHCSGSDTVVGGANVSSSIFAMLFVGWLVGMGMGAGLALYLRGRRSHETGNKNLSLTASPAAAKPSAGWVQSGARHVKTHSAAIRDEAVRTSGAEGPLGVGLVLQSINFKAEPSSQYYGQLKKPAAELWSNVDLTSEKGGVASKPASMALMPLEMPAEPYAEPLRVDVDATVNEVTSQVQVANSRAPLPEPGTAGLIRANWAGSRRSDRSLAASSLYSSSHTEAMSIREAAAAQSANPPAGQGRPLSTPPKAPPLPPTGRPSKPPAAAQRPPSGQAPMQAPPVPASGIQAKPNQAAQSHAAQPAQALSAEVHHRKQDEKSKAAAAVAQAYDLDELDDEWKALLNELEDRLLQKGAQGMDATDRAVAIRSLVVSTAREAPEVALQSALKEILRYRRTAA